MKLTLKEISEKQVRFIEAAVIILFALIPIFFTYPYRINIFLSWEGAYRMYLGQMPFKDFGIPVGYGYWLIPAAFFKIFGPYLSTLVKAQVLINIMAGFSFRSIFQTLEVPRGIRLLGVFLFVISYSFFNFWPWYNHTVIAFEIVGLALLLVSFKEKKKILAAGLTALAGFFLFLSFFTKQDGGVFALLIGGMLTVYHCIYKKSIKDLLVLAGSVAAVSLAVILPLLKHDFLYWFNLGQSPHYSRFNLFDILNQFFSNSLFIKFYLLVLFGVVLSKLRNARAFVANYNDFMLLLLTLGILVQATVLQVTSYTPPDGNIYFHSFCFIFILSGIRWDINFSSPKVAVGFMCFIVLWWSETYWAYSNRIIARAFPNKEADNKNVISINTYKLEKDSTALDKATWKLSGWKAFDRVYMPASTIDGIKRLKRLDVFAQGRTPKVLNMTELTPLAHELGYHLETDRPLWYHLNVALFDRELQQFAKRINAEYYDVVLFEIIPNLNNFNPSELRELLIEKYDKIDTFQAPRRKTTEVIEVYVRRKRPDMTYLN